MYKGKRPTDEEFEALNKKRDEAIEAAVGGLCDKNGWDRSKVLFHHSGHSHSKSCYCACPDGPCQHIWDGPNVPIGLEEGEPVEKALGWSLTCSLCGADSFSHDVRVME